MIKLNNKNITYVALADSNNSIKGVKEIWYADSSNSVKLVYRRKDALIEGEDYEKYHWLKGNGNAYISHPDIDDFEIKTYSIDNTRVIYERGYRVGESSQEVILQLGDGINLNFYSSLIISRLSGGAYANFRTNEISYGEHIIRKTSISENIGIFTDNVRHKKNSKNDLDYVGTEYVFNQLIPNFSTYIGYLSCTQIHLIPCKLLKPVPKWLDANGIRRQVGECGMIDLVSGKFYGNVNSVGTFTVENYYERKEWLQGRNGAYIDTNYYPIVGTDVFSVHFHYDGTVKNPDGGEQNAFGVNYKDSNGSNFIRAYIQKSNKLACSYYKYTDTYPTTNIQSNEWNIDNLLINGSKFQYTANGTSYSFDNNDIQQQICQFPLFIFKNNEQVWRNNNYYLHGDISTFKITDTSSNTKMNLIPCTLTMDLPASMDANNIARTKGTSGMWDLVSDRFYGNVANSGTFKAVNLAEGVDYEVHQWIIGDNVAYIDGLDYNLWTNTLEIKIGRVEGNCQYFGLKLVYDTQADTRPHFQMMTSGSTYRTYFRDLKNGQGWCGWFNISNMPSEVTFSYYNENGKAVGIINGVKTYDTISTNTITESVWNKYIPINTKDGNNIYTKLAKVSYIRELLPNNTYRSNLIPVKLLRSIPSKYDANGIARQAGECGMYDTVNDKFYGNVASSGSFTVEDDN